MKESSAKRPSKSKAFFQGGFEMERMALMATEEHIAELFKGFPEETLDTLVNLAVQTFNNETIAYRWLTRRNKILGGLSPINAVCDGRYEEITRLLLPIE
jgi:hypothetical protein